jgi:ABC-type transport system involved in multi-copper enzyme maturation permease subunit
MRYLILKDLLLQKWMLGFLFLYNIVLSTLWKAGNAHQLGALFGIILVMRISSCDGQRSYTLLNSLPIPRWKIVGAKYLSVLSYAVAVLLVSFLFGSALGTASASLVSLVSSLAAILAISSLYWPVHYLLDHAKSFVWLLIAFLGVSNFFSVVESLVASLLSGMSSGDLTLALVMGGIGAAMTAVSMWLSVRLCKQREF